MPKLVYIAHQVGGNVEENIRSVLKICREVHTAETIPVAPYLVAVQYLEDAVEGERALGMAANREYFTRKLIDELWLCGPRISAGMEGEVRLSLEHGIPIKCHNPSLESELERLVSQYSKEKP